MRAATLRQHSSKGSFLRRTQNIFSTFLSTSLMQAPIQGLACFCLVICAFVPEFGFAAPAASNSNVSNASNGARPQSQRKTQKKTNKQSSSARKNAQISDGIVSEGIIGEVVVVGQRKIEKDAILNRVKSVPGQRLSRDQVREDVLNLFKTGFFNDVVVSSSGASDKLILEYRVVEKPSIGELKFEGVVDLKTEEVQEASGLKAFEILNLGKLREATDKIQKFYEDKGFFLAKVETKIEDLKKDESVRITFVVTENEKVKVKKVTILGAQKVSESTLKGRLMTQEEGYFSGMSSSGAYKQEAFDRDMQIIRLVYFSQGYVQAKIDRPSVTVTPDKKGIYITVRVEEGEQYEVGEIDFAGDVLFPRDELFATIKIDENKIFAYDVLQKDMAELQAKYGDLGYAYANVIPRTRFHDKERKVDLVFEFDKGNKVYFGQINMAGNSKTRDKVVRRELKIEEGELYNETRRRQSLENIQRLGFFEDVNFKTSTPSDQPSVMNLEIVVKERNTGQIQLGAGYGTSQGFTLTGSVQQTNFLGRGQNLGVSLNLADKQSAYDFSFSEPYFQDTLWSAGVRVFQSNNQGRIDFDERKTGASFFLGHPLGDYLRANLNYTYTASRLFDNVFKESDGYEYTTDRDLYPLSTAEGDASQIGGSIEYDTRNDRFKSTKGIYARGSYSVTGLIGGNLHFQKLGADFRFFKNLFWDVIWRNSFNYETISSTRGDREVPFSELYLLGGPYSLRGYRSSRIGTTRESAALKAHFGANSPERYTRFFGGTQRAMYQGELLFPLVREAEMYGVLFFDVGQAEDWLTADNFFSDAGLGIRWFSPIGPLRFELGFPFKRTSIYHDASVFEFSIGTPF